MTGIQRRDRIGRPKRPRPYFGGLNPLEDGCATTTEQSRCAAPPVTPDTEPGILWDRLRASPEGIGESE
jgi:hypothetical protein